MWDVHEQTEGEDKSIAPPPATKTVVDDGRPGPTTSGDLLKILNRVWALEEQSHSSTSTITGLRTDLDRARSHAKELRIEQKINRKDIENLTKQLMDQEAMAEERQEEAVTSAIHFVKQDLDDEKEAKRKLELLHKKAAKELMDVKRSLGKTLQSLERERKARESMEDVRDELEREMGEDKTRVEELKRQSAKMREEMDDERKKMQMAAVGREAKLEEARSQLEERNAAVEELRVELQEFKQVKKTGC